MRFDLALGLVEAFTHLADLGRQCLQLGICGRRLVLPLSTGKGNKINQT